MSSLPGVVGTRTGNSPDVPAAEVNARFVLIVVLKDLYCVASLSSLNVVQNMADTGKPVRC